MLLIFLSILIITSCKTSKKTVDAAPTQEVYLSISMKKTACYGTCPVYEIQIYSDLSVKLKADQHLDKTGTFESKISGKRLDQIKAMFLEADFFSFKDQYTKKVTDLPTTYLYFNDSGKEKRVMDYYGAPESLKSLENEVASLLDELDWERIEE